MSYTTNPLIIIAAVGVVFTIITGFFLFRSKSTKARVLLSSLTIIFLIPSFLVVYIFYPWLIDSRFRTYRTFYKDIQIGMTRDQVMEVAKGHYPDGGKRLFPTIMRDNTSDLGFFMNPEGDSEPNCEGIFLRFEDGKVSSIVYSAD
jgi:hypothetical protein